MAPRKTEIRQFYLFEALGKNSQDHSGREQLLLLRVLRIPPQDMFVSEPEPHL